MSELLVPLWGRCPIHEATNDDELGIEARDTVVDLYYNQDVQPDELEGRLVASPKRFTPELAHRAGNCWGKIIRNYCETADIGEVGEDLGVISRKDIRRK